MHSVAVRSGDSVRYRTQCLAFDPKKIVVRRFSQLFLALPNLGTPTVRCRTD